MPDIEPRDSPEAPPDLSRGGFGVGCLVGCGSGILLFLFLVGASALVPTVPHSRRAQAWGTVLLVALAAAAYAGFVQREGRKALADQNLAYRKGLYVAFAIGLGFLLLNPFSLCAFISLCA